MQCRETSQHVWVSRECTADLFIFFFCFTFLGRRERAYHLIVTYPSKCTNGRFLERKKLLTKNGNIRRKRFDLILKCAQKLICSEWSSAQRLGNYGGSIPVTQLFSPSFIHFNVSSDLCIYVFAMSGFENLRLVRHNIFPL